MYNSSLFDEFFLLTLKISIYREISPHGHGKYVIDGLDERYKRYAKEKIKRLSKLLP